MKKIVGYVGAFSIIATLLPFIPTPHWSIRIFDFPHAQVSLLTALSLVGVLYYYSLKSIRGSVLAALLSAALLYQITLMVPYTFLAKPQVVKTDGEDIEGSLSVLSANIYMENRQSDRLLEKVEEYNPDIVLLLETDQWWADAVSSLKQDYPYFVEVPIDNTYGMLLYSRHKLIDPAVEYLVKDDIPSIHTEMELASGARIKLYAIHPEPPTPTESESSTPRDGELMICGKMVVKDTLPVVVIGDLNDVAWSSTTQLFQEVSQLLDPRIGRGFFNTFNANYPLLRWPLDHVFHSEDFKLVRMVRLPDIGSDHFPIFAHISLEPEAVFQQEPPKPTAEDLKEAEKKIEDVQ
ncbi:endonuclease/exonuclease/phosphatase family protein [Flavilitoribacter nigricans]|uniref:Endonuclease n=1 Tax=Flavilitoribacter nigricans (strain ATCC 23147 / DSM 23189 / NBRC 102662 / NCIMB 1420 / SS-2) TaxID=1122177 RepID=A0A2D0N8Q5_FLAN2|nr:endonuclease/exonuclease/phosphatase family protein [Flavilitoribacter nigricans]PHN04776.1 endonuclease [Flavilitoribacter nigricans DSM 23189 = NBRC 102662]